MSNIESDKDKKRLNSTNKELRIGDFANFSVVEILTMQTLLRQSEPVIRHTLYQEVNLLVHRKRKKSATEEILTNSLKEKTLSTSSFYNSLNMLEKKGLIKFNYNKKKKNKIDSVEATQKTKTALKVINQYFLGTLINDFEYIYGMAEDILKKIGPIEVLLTVWLRELLDINLIKYLTKTSDDLFLLCHEEQYKELNDIGVEDIKKSSIYSKVIREPNNFFNVVVVPSYIKNLNFFGLSRIELLKELNRVTKKDGVIVIIIREKFPSIQNFYANELLKLYAKSFSERIFSKEELKEDMINAGLSKIEILDFNGLIAGIGWVS